MPSHHLKKKKGAKSFNLLGKYENKTYLAGPCINPEIPKSDSNTEFIFSFHDSLIDCACRSNILQAFLINIMRKSNFFFENTPWKVY